MSFARVQDGSTELGKVLSISLNFRAGATTNMYFIRIRAMSDAAPQKLSRR